MSQPLNPAEEILHGGNSTLHVVRVANTVRRPVAQAGEYVHSVLLLLEEAGFAAAPRYQGQDEQGREILTFIEGEVPHNVKDITWSEDQLRCAITLLRGMHDATAGTALAGSEQVVCHNDFAPWNVVFRDDVPTAIIDFDDASPGSRIRDVSYAIWCWLGLGSNVHTVEDQSQRMRFICDVYGLTDRATLVEEISERQHEIQAKHTLAGRSQNAEWVQADIDWLKTNKAALHAALIA